MTDAPDHCCAILSNWWRQGYYDGLTFPSELFLRDLCSKEDALIPSDPDSQTERGLEGQKADGKYTTSEGKTIVRNRGGNNPDEHPDNAQYTNEVGTLSMANTGRPDSGGSQFFINTKHNNFLDWWDKTSPSAHPVFGRVIGGMDVVRAIENTPTSRSDRPKQPQKIISVRME